MTTRVKICGIRTASVLEAALDAGADYIGLVFFPPSPRHLEFQQAAALAVLARGRTASPPGVVALVVAPDDRLIEAVVHHIRPDIVQLHGKETPERVRDIRSRLQRLAPGTSILKAISVETTDDVRRGDAYWKPGELANMILFDAKPPKGAALPGGNGQTFDWSLLDDARRRFPFMLSGGLTPDNVGHAIRLTGAEIVDVSSGVETAPGEKSPELIRAFIRAAKGGAATSPPRTTP